MIANRFLVSVFAAVALCFAATPRGVHAQDLPDLYFIDAHSQMAGGLDETRIVPLMDKAGVWKTLLSARNDRSPEDVAAYATAHPDRIVAAVRTKGGAYNNNSPKYGRLLKGQMQQPVFAAMAEALLYHAQKGTKAPKIEVAADSAQVKTTLKATLAKGWPFIAHYEFAASGWDKAKLIADFEGMAKAHPDHPFVLIHMAQLDQDEAARLIAARPNVYFITSHCNPVSIADNPGQPWSNLFEGDGLAPKWRALIESHPDRFILAFDNVFPEMWGELYLKQAALWRKALGALPPAVAHAVAHGNAERLWKIAPLRP